METKTLHVRAGGGIGDFIYTYFRKRPWKLVENIKKHNKNIKIMAILTCHASAARELIELNPNIDAILTHDWKPPKHPDERLWKQLVITEDIEKYAKKNNIEPGQNKMYLSPTEKKRLIKLREKPYIVIHPFAGLPHRGCKPHPKDGKYKCFPDYKYIEVAEELQKQNINVIILGRSERGRTGIRCQDEILNITGPKINNIINDSSLRMSVEITRHASGFIGTHSSMLSAAWTKQIPSVFFYPTNDEHGNVRSVMQHGGETGKWAYKEKWTECYELQSPQFEELKAIQVINRLKGLMK